MVRVLVGCIALVMLIACKPDSPEKKSGGGNLVLGHGFTLSQGEFNLLSADDQFVVANKALSTMYRGLPMDQYFDLTLGLESPSIQFNNFINILY